MAHRKQATEAGRDAPAVPYDLNRLAPLVAEGRVAFPTDLDSEEEAGLVAAVSELRRRRIVRFVAQAIARSLVAGDGPNERTRRC